MIDSMLHAGSRHWHTQSAEASQNELCDCSRHTISDLISRCDPALLTGALVARETALCSAWFLVDRILLESPHLPLFFPPTVHTEPLSQASMFSISELHAPV